MPDKGYSISALADKLGSDRATIRRAIKGIKPVRDDGNVKYYRLIDAEQALKERSEKNGSLKDEKLGEEIRKLRIANDHREGLLVSKSKEREDVLSAHSQIRKLLEQKFLNESPTAVAGMDPAQVRIYHRRVLDETFLIMQKLEGRK